MKVIFFERKAFHLDIRNLYAGWVPSLVQLCLHFQSSCSARVAYKLYYGFEGSEWFTTPVFGDLAEETMLDLVPFAGPRWKV